MEWEAKTKTQHREHRGPSTENTKKETDSRRPELGNHGRKEKAPARMPLLTQGKRALQNGLDTGLQAIWDTAGKKTPRQDRGALLYENYCITLILAVKSTFALCFEVFLILCFQ